MFGVMASPGTHRQLVKQINKWEYEIEGKYFKGKQAPYISEIKFYDIRIPEEIKNEVIRDLHLHGTGQGVCSSWKFNLAMWAYKKFLSWFTPFKPIPVVGGKPKYKILQGTWNYILPIGMLKRKKMEVQGGDSREVL